MITSGATCFRTGRSPALRHACASSRNTAKPRACPSLSPSRPTKTRSTRKICPRGSSPQGNPATGSGFMPRLRKRAFPPWILLRCCFPARGRASFTMTGIPTGTNAAHSSPTTRSWNAFLPERNTRLTLRSFRRWSATTRVTSTTSCSPPFRAAAPGRITASRRISPMMRERARHRTRPSAP